MFIETLIVDLSLQAYLQSEDFRVMVDSMKRRERERIMREVSQTQFPILLE